MRRAFTGLATVLMLAVVVQFFLAGSGAFDTAPNDESFETHRALGYGIFLFAILLTIVAALVRMPGRLVGMTGLVAGLALLQGVIAAIADATEPLVFGLHAVNGLVIMATAGTIVRQARALSGSAASTSRAGPAQQAS